MWLIEKLAHLPDTMKARRMTRDQVVDPVLLAAQPTKAFVQPHEVPALALLLCSDMMAAGFDSLLCFFECAAGRPLALGGADRPAADQLALCASRVRAADRRMRPRRTWGFRSLCLINARTRHRRTRASLQRVWSIATGPRIHRTSGTRLPSTGRTNVNVAP